MENKIIGVIQIPKYITEVMLSKKRLPRYIFDEVDCNVTQLKRLNKGEYKFQTALVTKTRKAICLCDLEGNPIIKNAFSVNKPKMQAISGQLFYSGFSHYSVRQKIVEEIKNNFLVHFKKLKPLEKFPIQVDFIYYDELNLRTTGSVKNKTRRKQSKDVDNLRMAYEKCSLDLLTTLKKIPDDNLQFIRKISSEFIPSNERKLQLVIREYVQSNIIVDGE
jgi:hypothetical protein